MSFLLLVHAYMCALHMFIVIPLEEAQYSEYVGHADDRIENHELVTSHMICWNL
jgi:hypothetical protein